MKYLAAILVALALCFIVTACGGSGIDSGTIIAKEDVAPYDSEWFMMVGKVMMPMTEHHDEEWVLKLEACEVNSDCKTGHVNVSQGDFEQVQIGEQWTSEH